jgi:hypothetical protein
VFTITFDINMWLRLLYGTVMVRLRYGTVRLLLSGVRRLGVQGLGFSGLAV